MKVAVTLMMLVVIAMAVVYLTGRPMPAVRLDPEVQKFARINSTLAIEMARLHQDSALFESAKDSILKAQGITREWLDGVKARLDRKPEDWIAVYDMMIAQTEKVRDSLLHRRRLPSESAPSPAVTSQP